MPSYRSSTFFLAPYPAVSVLMAMTVVYSGVCFVEAGKTPVPLLELYYYGGMYREALELRQYWRLVAAGFLHVDFVHFAMNMLCLAIWGSRLESRVGAAYLLIVYLGSMVAGSLVGNALHPAPYLSVGASGATSGLLGALFCLWILDKTDLTLDFFAINIFLNVVAAFANPTIDWSAHLGGFVSGLIICAVLDLVEKANPHLLRCKFPEFVKVNLTVLACAAMALLVVRLQAQPPPGGVWAEGLALAGLFAGVVKAVDVGLSVRRGLMIVVVGLATLNAFAAMQAGMAVANAVALSASFATRPDRIIAVLFWSSAIWGFASGIGAGALTMWACWRDFVRGRDDVGFVCASMRAERSRRRGL